MRPSAIAVSLMFFLAASALAERVSIGVTSYTASDRSRPGSGGEWRTIEGLIWYPAQGGGTVGTRATYFAMASAGLSGDPSGDTVKEDVKLALSRVLEGEPGDERLDLVMSEALDVRVDATPDPGPYPIVLVSAGLRSPPHALSTLCEAIARAGHVVVAIRTSPLWSDSLLRFDQVAVETMMRDLETTLGDIATRPWADSSRVALVGWSIGSVANVLLQMRNPLVDALVSLDGGVGYDYGAALARESIWFSAEPQTTPLLDIRALGTSGVPRAFDVLDLPRAAPRWLLEDDRLEHGELTAISDLASRVSETATPNSDALGFIHEVVAAFLETVFDGDGAESSMTDLATAAPEGSRLRRVAPASP